MVKSAQTTEINNEIQKMPLVMKVYIIYLHHDKGTSICELETRFSDIPNLQFLVQPNKRLTVPWRIKGITTKGDLVS